MNKQRDEATCIRRIFHALGRLLNFGIDAGPDHRLERRETMMYAAKTGKKVKERPTMFLVGQVNEQNKDRWKVMGLFYTKEMAKFHCTSWYDFYVPIKTGEYLEETPGRCSGCRYPVAEDYYMKHPDEVPEEARERYAELIASFRDMEETGYEAGKEALHNELADPRTGRISE